ncbi:MAG: ATP-binding protein [Pseudomonadales bacterium]
MVNLPILELLKHRLETLSKPCLQLLRMAACIGHRFELMLLSAVAKTDSASIKKNLQEAVQRGVILELKPEREQDRVNEKIMYQFEHDQLQQVCYEFVEEDDKAGLHLVIARWLLQASEGDDKEVLLMRIVEHYNAGSALISNQQERTDLARLDLAAVEKSKAAAAYQPALAYIESATNLLAADAWETDYALTFAIYQHYSDCAHLCSDFERAEKINTLLLQQAKTPLEKGQIYLLQCQQYALSKNHALAIDKGLEGLAVFGVKMSATPSRLAILWQFFLAKWYLRGRTPQDLLAQEFVTNRELQTIMKLYQEIIQPAVYSGRRKLFVITGMRALVHSLRQGNTAESAFSYVAYGFILSHYLNDPKKGDEFGKLSLAMAERCQDDKVKCRSLHGHTISNLCWSQPWETITETLSDAIKVAERCGDVYIIPQIRLDQIMWNPRLEYSAAAEQIKKLYLFSERHKNKHGMIGSRIYYQRITNILGKTHHLLSLNSDGFDTDKFLEDAPPSHHNFIKTLYFVCHLEFIFFYENYAGIVKLLRQKGHLIKSLVGHPSTVQISFTAFLSLSLALQNVSFYNKAFVKRRMKSAYKKMKKWADHCPINFLHRQLLMEAEFARHAKDYHQAEQRYDQAIQTAQQNGFLRDEAVANELAAKYYLSQGRTRIASDYFTAAKAGYEHISMIAKLRHMEQHYADLLALKTDTAQPDASNPPVNLDLDTVRDGIELIATEDNIDQVLQQVIRLLLENAGAQRICLFLLQEDTLHLEVEGIHDKTLTIQRRTCPLDEVNTLPTAIIHHTARKKQAFLLSDADEHPWLAQDPYLQQHPTISILSMPLLYAGELSGLIYLENTSTDAAFTPQRLEIVKILGFQAMAAINHIRSSELKDEALQEKALAIEKLQRADTIKDEFLANTSHELRTPLHGIIGITESLLDGAKGTLDPTVSADLDLVVSSSKRLTHLVNDLLDAAQLKHRAIRLEQKALDLLSIVQLILRLNSAHAEHKSLQLLNEVPDFLPAVWADENRLYQILQGLIGNAIKFTDSGQITVSATRQDETLCITVTDTGRGIPAGQWQRIFQSFEQIEASQTKTQQGSGLGLSITKALVELHGGRIWLESIPGQGSHFHFTLPLSHTVAIAETNPVIARIEAPLQSPPAFNAVAATTAGLFQILVVDDDPINLQIVSRYLADQPYQIITAASGQEALQKVAQAKPDLILLDVMMPHLDGFDVCRQIRATYPDYELPIIFLTARYQSTQITELVVQTDQAGGDDYLTRPFSKDELRSKIARQLSWLTLIRRSQALGQFGNQIAQLNDIDQLHQATFELLANDNYIQDIALFREDTLVCCRGDQQQLEQVFQVCNKAQAKNKASITPFNWDDKDYLFIQLQEQASLLAHLPFALAEIEEKLLHNMIYPAIHQIGINQDNLHKFVHDPKFLSNTYKISNELKTIHYIEADGHDVKVYSNKHRSGELLEIAIGKVTSCFNDCLLPVHRSYLVNPDWVIRAQRRANHFDLVVGHRHYTKKVPIGDKYLQGIREDYAMWFEK